MTCLIHQRYDLLGEERIAPARGADPLLVFNGDRTSQALCRKFPHLRGAERAQLDSFEGTIAVQVGDRRRSGPSGSSRSVSRNIPRMSGRIPTSRVRYRSSLTLSRSAHWRSSSTSSSGRRPVAAARSAERTPSKSTRRRVAESGGGGGSAPLSPPDSAGTRATSLDCTDSAVSGAEGRRGRAVGALERMVRKGRRGPPRTGRRGSPRRSPPPLA